MATLALSAETRLPEALALLAAEMPAQTAEANKPRRVARPTATDCMIVRSRQRWLGISPGRTHETWVMKRLSAAKHTADVVANRGVG